MPDNSRVNERDNDHPGENNSESRGSSPPVATVTPSKKTYDSIASDISVESAVGELIDNALDSAALHGKDVAEIEFRVEERDGEQVFVVEDRCGGVEEGEMGVFMGLGQSRAERADDQQVGTFGMGAKRALRRLGQSFRIESRHQDADQGWGYTVPSEWFESDDESPDEWSFPLESVEELPAGVTRIELRQLEFDPEDQAGDLREWIGTVYHKFLQDDTDVDLSLEITVLGETVDPPEPVEWSFPPWFGGIHPYRFEGLAFIDHNGEGEVQARVTVGIMREGDSERCGTFVYGQHRLIEGNLMDERGGFGVELNQFQESKHKRLRIEIELFGDADDLPWSADKSRLRPNHHTLAPSPSKGIYWWLGRMADRHMRATRYGSFGDFVGSKNVFDPYNAESEMASNGGEVEIVDVAEKQRRLRRGEVSHVRIRGKPSNDYQPVNRLGRIASAHARLGVTADVTDLLTAADGDPFEEWARPTYERQLGEAFVDAYYDSDENHLDETAARLLDVDDPVSFVETALDEDVGRIARHLTRLDSENLPPVDDWSLDANSRDELDRKLEEIDDIAEESVDEESLRASEPPWAAAYYRACVATHASEDASVEEFAETDRGIFETEGGIVLVDSEDTDTRSSTDDGDTPSAEMDDVSVKQKNDDAGLGAYTDDGERSATGVTRDRENGDTTTVDEDVSTDEESFEFGEDTPTDGEQPTPSMANRRGAVEQLFEDLDEGERELVTEYLGEEALDDDEELKENLLAVLEWMDANLGPSIQDLIQSKP